MRNINDLKFGINLQQLSLYCAHQIIGAANVGCKRNKWQDCFRLFYEFTVFKEKFVSKFIC